MQRPSSGHSKGYSLKMHRLKLLNYSSVNPFNLFQSQTDNPLSQRLEGLPLNQCGGLAPLVIPLSGPLRFTFWSSSSLHDRKGVFRTETFIRNHLLMQYKSKEEHNTRGPGTVMIYFVGA